MNLNFISAVDSAVETVRMTDALLQQLFYQEVAAQHQIAETFRIIQSHGEQVGWTISHKAWRGITLGILVYTFVY